MWQPQKISYFYIYENVVIYLLSYNIYENVVIYLLRLTIYQFSNCLYTSSCT